MVSKYESGDCNISLKKLCDLCEKLGWGINLNLENIQVSELNLTLEPEREIFRSTEGLQDAS